MAATIGLSSDVVDVVEQIVAHLHPQRIILFGSHASGTADEGSDVDLLVVMETPLRPLQQAAEISRALDQRVPADFLVRTPEQVAIRHPQDQSLRTVLQEGIAVYEAGN
jgi:predicted nucleotidyltransferase